jgi:DNA replication protein DnaC
VRTLFVTATVLIATLGKALAEGKLEEQERIKLLTQPQLLIIDEIGYLPIDRQGANLFFQLVRAGAIQSVIRRARLQGPKINKLDVN